MLTWLYNPPWICVARQSACSDVRNIGEHRRFVLLMHLSVRQVPPRTPYPESAFPRQTTNGHAAAFRSPSFRATLPTPVVADASLSVASHWVGVILARSPARVPRRSHRSGVLNLRCPGRVPASRSGVRSSRHRRSRCCASSTTRNRARSLLPAAAVPPRPAPPGSCSRPAPGRCRAVRRLPGSVP